MEKRLEASKLKEVVAPPRLKLLALPGFSSKAEKVSLRGMKLKISMNVKAFIKTYLLATTTVDFFERFFEPETSKYKI